MPSGSRFSAGTAVPARLGRSRTRRLVADNAGVRMNRQAVRLWLGALGAAALVMGFGAVRSPAVTPKIGGCPVFPAFKGSPTARSGANQTAWNQNVSRAPVDPRSGHYIARITGLGGNQVVHPDFGGNGAYGIPYTSVGRRQRRVQVNVTG